MSNFGTTIRDNDGIRNAVLKEMRYAAANWNGKYREAAIRGLFAFNRGAWEEVAECHKLMWSFKSDELNRGY